LFEKERFRGPKAGLLSKWGNFCGEAQEGKRKTGERKTKNLSHPGEVKLCFLIGGSCTPRE